VTFLVEVRGMTAMMVRKVASLAGTLRDPDKLCRSPTPTGLSQ
jgi:hypothetical protein